MYGIFRKERRHSLPVYIQLKLFDSLALPILLYCCEVWGFEKLENIEQVHLTFGKIILCVKKCTPNFIIYASNLVIMADSVQQKTHPKKQTINRTSN